MGQLVNGVWHSAWTEAKNTGGRFLRPTTSFRDRIGPNSKFTPEKGRYHLYVSLACPWAHRTMIVGSLKGLFGDLKPAHLSPTTNADNAIIPLHVVSPLMLENGWTFETSFPGTTGDSLNHKKFAHEIYTAAEHEYTGKVTVPILWDTKLKTIVNNESQEICEIFNSAFDSLEGVKKLDFLPSDIDAKERDELDNVIYNKVNNGVYKCGFAITQEAYDENVGPLFDNLDMLEKRLSKQRYLLGDRLTLSDIKLWTTLIRFDHVYVGHFKCDKKTLRSDYPVLSNYMRDIYQTGVVADTVSMDHIRNHYYRSHPFINPHTILSIGPEIDFSAPHNRANL